MRVKIEFKFNDNASSINHATIPNLAISYNDTPATINPWPSNTNDCYIDVPTDSVLDENLIRVTGAYTGVPIDISFPVYGYDYTDTVISDVGNTVSTIIPGLLSGVPKIVISQDTRAFASALVSRKPFTNQFRWDKTHTDFQVSDEAVSETVMDFKIRETGTSNIVYQSSISGEFFTLQDGSYDVVYDTKLYEVENGVRTLIHEDTLTLENQIKVSKECFSFAQLIDFVGCTTCGEDSTNIFNTNTLGINPILSDRGYIVDEALQNGWEAMILYSEIVRPDGTILATKTSNFINSAYPFEYNYLLDLLSFDLDKPGDYTIKTNMKVYANYVAADDPANILVYETDKEKIIKSEDFLSVEEIDCNNIEVTNHASTVITLKLYQLQDDKTFLELESYDLNPNSINTLNIPSDGVFKLQANREEACVNCDPFLMVLHTFCAIQECLRNLIKEFICNPPCCDECAEIDSARINSIVITSYSYFTLLNTEYNYSCFYEDLTDGQIEELYEMSQILKVLTDYCDNCKPFDSDNDCGCK